MIKEKEELADIEKDDENHDHEKIGFIIDDDDDEEEEEDVVQ